MLSKILHGYMYSPIIVCPTASIALNGKGWGIGKYENPNAPLGMSLNIATISLSEMKELGLSAVYYSYNHKAVAGHKL